MLYNQPNERDVAIQELDNLMFYLDKLRHVLDASLTLLRADLHTVSQCHEVIDKALNEFNNVINGIGQQSMGY